jgi:hypothetical protein
MCNIVWSKESQYSTISSSCNLPVNLPRPTVPLPTAKHHQVPIPMRYQIPSVLASAVFVASQSPTPFTPFNLQVLSSNSATLNNTSLYICHEGAATEGLCWSKSPIDTTLPWSDTFNLSFFVTPYGTFSATSHSVAATCGHN